MSCETTHREQLAKLQLHMIPGLGPRGIERLLQRFGSAEAVFRQTAARLGTVRRIGDGTAGRIVACRAFEAAQREWQDCRRLGVQLLFDDQDQYPPPLRQLPDPPPVLYARGHLVAQDAQAIAIVGSRNCTHYGQRMAQRLAGDLAAMGWTIVSGLARGIDAAAHRACLDAGGRTIAVVASPLDEVYPPQHVELATEVAASGVILSETPLRRRPRMGAFPQRNRLISGLARAIIVVEATHRSGTLHTVRHALDQGREVMAVPGRVDSPTSEGCLALLADGAALIRNADDVLAAVGNPRADQARPRGQTLAGRSNSQRTPVSAAMRPAPQIDLQSLPDGERAVLQLMTQGPVQIDELLRQCPLPDAEVLSLLTLLEIKRLVQRTAGGFIESLVEG